jgi:hypothetical protein
MHALRVRELCRAIAATESGREGQVCTHGHARTVKTGAGQNGAVGSCRVPAQAPLSADHVEPPPLQTVIGGTGAVTPLCFPPAPVGFDPAVRVISCLAAAASCCGRASVVA